MEYAVNIFCSFGTKPVFAFCSGGQLVVELLYGMCGQRFQTDCTQCGSDVQANIAFVDFNSPRLNSTEIGGDPDVHSLMRFTFSSGIFSPGTDLISWIT